jgi:subtilisin family serine protease
VPDPGTGDTPGRPTPRQVPTSPDLVLDSVISRPLQERMAAAAPDEPIGVVIEVNGSHVGGRDQAHRQLDRILARMTGADTPRHHDGAYLTTALTRDGIRELVARDAEAAAQPGRRGSPPTTAGASRAPRHAIHRIWPNFEVTALITRSVVTTKCEAAHRSFNATGRGVVWAVMDSGVDAAHGHFAEHGNVDPEGDLHRSFVSDEPGDALNDEMGHGTHVAGIVAGFQQATRKKPLLAAGWFQDERRQRQSQAMPLTSVSGMAPETTLVSLKVLRADGSGDVRAMLAALQYVQEVNDGGRNLRIHGLNISVGYPFDPAWFAAGLTPVCREVERLVKSGVLVVVAAGNTGYGVGVDTKGRTATVGFAMTIQDPGNAELALTVGATSATPHLTGVSFFSSKGPTGDGRLKPDLVAPGERVLSAAAGAKLAEARQEVPGATYVEDSGTSMAAPHVSGAAAGFLSVHQEFLGRPEDVKRVLMESATDLGRARHFQGAGLVDAMRSIQAV